MLKLILIVIVSIIAIGALLYFFYPRVTFVSHGKFYHLQKRFNEFINGVPELELLIIHVSGSDDFIQFARSDDSVEIDFPVITDRQKALESDYKQICIDLGLEIKESTGSDGSRFLDSLIPNEPPELARITETILSRLYGASDSTTLRFTLIQKGI